MYTHIYTIHIYILYIYNIHIYTHTHKYIYTMCTHKYTIHVYMCVYIYIYIYTYILFQIFSPVCYYETLSRVSYWKQETAGPCWLSILHIAVCIY